MSESEARAKDIFISYCHDDNDNPLGEGWIEQFHKTLRSRLKQILGRGNEPGIWRDKELQGNQEFAEVLSEELRRARIVISVLSPSYVDSDWCKREIEEFVRAAERQGGLTVGEHETRLFKVLKTPVARERHPAALQGQIGFEFYIKDEDTGIPREFSLLQGDKNTSLALDRFNDLAYHIVATLEAVQVTFENRAAAIGGATLEQVNTPTEGVATPAAVVPTGEKPLGLPIYLAQTSLDIAEEEKKVRRELEARGYRVLPTGDLPGRDPSHFKAAVREALDQCQLSIHMIGAKRDTILAGERDDMVVLQNELAAERSRESGLDRLIWLPEGPSPEDESQRRFIEKLQKDPAAQTRAEVLQVPLQELITIIHDTLKKKEAARTRQASEDRRPEATGPQRIYAAYAREDEAAISPLIDHLFDSGFDVLEPLLDENAQDDQIVEVHKRNLTDCDATLLFADNGGEFWLRTQMSDLQRAALWRGNKPMLARVIYLGPNMTAAKRRLRTHDLMLLEGGEAFASETLAPFLAKLGESRGAQA